MKLTNSPILFFWQVLKEFKWLAFGIFFTAALAQGFYLLTPYVSKYFVDFLTSVDGATEKDFYKALFFVFGLMGLYLTTNVLRKLSNVIFNYFSQKIIWTKVEKNLLIYTCGHSYNFFLNNFSGRLSGKIESIGDGFQEFTVILQQAFLPLFIAIFIGTGTFFSVSTTLGIIALVWMILFTVIALILGPKKNKLNQKRTELNSQVSGFKIDLLTNLTSVRFFSRQKLELSSLENLLLERAKIGLKSSNFTELIGLTSDVLIFVLRILLLSFVVYLWYQGKATVGDIVLVIGLSEMIASEFRNLGMNINSLFGAYGDIKNGLETISVPIEVVDQKGAKKLKIKNGEIEFKNLDFSYKETKIFENLNLKIEPGEKVGIVGSSGVGKSTLIRLLLRLYDLNSGQILLDGQEVAKVTQESLREQIALIPQEVDLFHRSIFENISYGKIKATKREVEEAAKKSESLDFIKKLPKGFDTLVGERGVKLSMGQRQRIAIARAILKDSKLLILDEATSALDSVNEAKIQKALDFAMKNKTVIAIAHRLSTLKNMDRIVVLLKGGKIESGTHEELLKKSKTYKELWSHQVNGYIK